MAARDELLLMLLFLLVSVSVSLPGSQTEEVSQPIEPLQIVTRHPEDYQDCLMLIQQGRSPWAQYEQVCVKMCV
jgi:hypothetical protein